MQNSQSGDPTFAQGVPDQVEDTMIPEDNDVLPEPSVCQELYERSGECKKLLLVMCIGLTADDSRGARKLADIGSKPYANAKEKKSFKYTNEMLCNEVI